MKKALVGILFSTAGLYVAFRQMEMDDLRSAFSGVDWPAIVLASAIMVASVWIRALRWKIILSPIRNVGTHSLFSATMIGYFGNSILPLRMGEFMRAFALSRGGHSVTASATFGTLIVERLLDMIGFMVLMLVLFSSYQIPSWLANSGLILSVVVILLSTILFWIASSRKEWVNRLERLSILQKGIGLKLKSVFHSLIEGIATLRSGYQPGGLVFYSSVLWLMYWSIAWLSAQALDIEMSLLQLGIVMVSITMVIILPSAPGFIGTYHAGAVLVLVEVFNVDQTPAQAYAIINHAIGFVPLVIIGALYFFRSSLKLGDVTSMEISTNG
ncbi:MAG: lysylphosphatidylglycerol synthase transmembrane domain-containing protein [Candidatus Neomarinimicrobiota bacterium]|nr:lysylphosphatidylglycerol synthase transmembrane domain-containing protein [Candidatus Neomarinimicrobiota bacterium]